MESAAFNWWIFWRASRVSLVLILSSDEVQHLTPLDVEMLRDDCGAGDRMLGHLRELARVPGRGLKLHFDRQAIELLDAKDL